MPRTAVAQTILDEAIRVVESGGESAIRLRDLVAETGIALATIYKYFDNREGLVDSAYAEMYLRSAIVVFSDFERAVATVKDAREFADLLVLFFRRQAHPEAAARRATRMTVLGSCATRPGLAAKVAEMNREYVDVFVATLGPAQERGWIKQKYDLRTLAIWFLGAINDRGPFDVNPADWDLDQMNSIIEDTILSLLVLD